jgi:hypothetical protein
MAHVAISRDFLNRVDNKIDRMQAAEFKSLGAEPKITMPPNSPVMLETFWGTNLHLRNQIPDTWRNRSNCARVHFNTKTTKLNSDGEPAPVSMSVNINPTHGEFDFPPDANWHTTRFLSEATREHPAFTELYAYGDAKAEIEIRWHTVRTKVTEFFKSCKSMKEAVTLWPDCKVYIDDEDIARFEKKVVKTASQDSDAAKVLAGLDTDQLMGAAVVARLSGAA